ncbi:MAG: thiamine pyrophosphate-dependent enzyme [Planctomycetaceae bacterium]|nr:thiamine pyrophosphate-dependent enzyme [Planctomycetaceae bacterium]
MSEISETAFVKKADMYPKIRKIAAGIRRRVLEHTLTHNGGYLSQACSSAEIFAVLYGKILKLAPLEVPLVPPEFPGTPGTLDKNGKCLPAFTGAAFNGNGQPDCDNFILSPAQYALVLYAALIETGRMDTGAMAMYNKDGGTVEMIGAEHSPGMEVTTGSLGQGISQAAGLAFARKRRGDAGRVVMFMSDGECQSGQFWEAVQAAAHHRLGNMLIYVDVNGCQCDGKTADVMNLEPFDERLKAFGADVVRIDGHDIEQIIAAARRKPPVDRPLFVLCDTDPCRDMPVLKCREKYHYIRFTEVGEKEELQRFYDSTKSVK